MRLVYLLSLLTFVSASQAADDSIQYNRDVRPILAETVSPATARTAPRARPTCGWTSAKRPSTAGPSCRASRTTARPSAGFSPTDADEVMPPPAHARTAHAGPEGHAAALGRRRGEYQPHWSLIAAGASAAAGGQECGLGPQPDRRLHPGEAGGARPEAGARSRPPHAGPPAEPRPDRPAARPPKSWKRS